MRRSLVVLLAFFLVGWSLGGQQIAAQMPEAVVDIRDFSFEPHEVKINVGGAVRWVNRDPAVHQIAMEGGRPGNSPILEAGKEHAVTFQDAGRFTYRCGVHPTMLGVILVE